jgi:hypothetical protein
LNFSCRALRFIGSAERRLWKPWCISPDTARQIARAALSFGSRLAFGYFSSRYSAIASVSQTVTSPSVSLGTSTEGLSSNSSWRWSSSMSTSFSSKSSPAMRQSSQPRSDQDE